MAGSPQGGIGDRQANLPGLFDIVGLRFPVATRESDMTEAEAKAYIVGGKSGPHNELVAADKWLKEYALAKLNTRLDHGPLAEFILPMARAYFGSVEVDKLMQDMLCYPEWLR